MHKLKRTKDKLTPWFPIPNNERHSNRSAPSQIPMFQQVRVLLVWCCAGNLFHGFRHILDNDNMTDNIFTKNGSDYSDNGSTCVPPVCPCYTSSSKSWIAQIRLLFNMKKSLVFPVGRTVRHIIFDLSGMEKEDITTGTSNFQLCHHKSLFRLRKKVQLASFFVRRLTRVQSRLN